MEEETSSHWLFSKTLGATKDGGTHRHSIGTDTNILGGKFLITTIDQRAPTLYISVSLSPSKDSLTLIGRQREVEGVMGEGWGRNEGIEGNSRGQQGLAGWATLGASQIRSIFSLAHILARLYSWLISNQWPFVSIRQHLHSYTQGQITESGNKGEVKRGGGDRERQTSPSQRWKGVKQGTCK